MTFALGRLLDPMCWITDHANEHARSRPFQWGYYGEEDADVFGKAVPCDASANVSRPALITSPFSISGE
jgi:hypothetical protein